MLDPARIMTSIIRHGMQNGVFFPIFVDDCNVDEVPDEEYANS